jgi:hypothetical protein
MASHLGSSTSCVRYLSLSEKARRPSQPTGTHKENGKAALHPSLRGLWVWACVWLGNNSCRLAITRFSRLDFRARQTGDASCIARMVSSGQNVERSISRPRSVPARIPASKKSRSFSTQLSASEIGLCKAHETGRAVGEKSPSLTMSAVSSPLRAHECVHSN